MTHILTSNNYADLLLPGPKDWATKRWRPITGSTAIYNLETPTDAIRHTRSTLFCRRRVVAIRLLAATPRSI